MDGGFSCYNYRACRNLIGHPIWTHHFASQDLWKAMQGKILEQCPGMPIGMPGVTADNYQQKIAELEEELGPVAMIRAGDGGTAMHPLEGIPAGKPVILAQTDPPEHH